MPLAQEQKSGFINALTCYTAYMSEQAVYNQFSGGELFKSEIKSYFEQLTQSIKDLHIDFNNLTTEDCIFLGCDKTLRIPLHLIDAIPEGTNIFDVYSRESGVWRSDLDNDSRFGRLAFCLEPIDYKELDFTQIKAVDNYIEELSGAEFVTVSNLNMEILLKRTGLYNELKYSGADMNDLNALIRDNGIVVNYIIVSEQEGYLALCLDNDNLREQIYPVHLMQAETKEFCEVCRNNPDLQQIVETLKNEIYLDEPEKRKTDIEKE